MPGTRTRRSAAAPVTANEDESDDEYVDADVLAYEAPHHPRRSVAPVPDAGAGAILFSSLVYQGWRFPPFLLVDTDEKHLFELEIKVRRVARFASLNLHAHQ